LLEATLRPVCPVALIHGRGQGPRGTASESICWASGRGPPSVSTSTSSAHQWIPSPSPTVWRDFFSLVQVALHFGGSERLSRFDLGLRTVRALGLSESNSIRRVDGRHLVPRPPTRPSTLRALCESSAGSLDPRAGSQRGPEPSLLTRGFRPAFEDNPMMDRRTLEDHLRRPPGTLPRAFRRTRSFGRFTLGRALVAAHGASPARYPGIDPSRITMDGDSPCLDDAPGVRWAAEGLFELGARSCGSRRASAPLSRGVSIRPPACALDLLRRAALGRLSRRGPTPASRPPLRLRSPCDAQSEHGRRTRRPLGPSSVATPRARASIRTVLASKPLTSLGCSSSGPLWRPAGRHPTLHRRRNRRRSFSCFLDRASGRLAHIVRLGAAVESSPALTSIHVVVARTGRDRGRPPTVGRKSLPQPAGRHGAILPSLHRRARLRRLHRRTRSRRSRGPLRDADRILVAPEARGRLLVASTRGRACPRRLG